MSKKFTTEYFIQRAKLIHGDKYDYSKTIYCNSSENVIITCREHGDFKLLPSNHLKGMGCPKCKHRGYKLTTKEFIEKAKEVHGDKYDYSKVEYINANTKICIICPEHGEFWQLPNNHLRTGGCSKCGKKAITSSTIKFIQKSGIIHLNKYDYSKVNYINNCTKVIITCPEHGDFEQTPNCHLSGCGCPKCNSSKGEITVLKILDKAKIKYQKLYCISIDTNINPSGKAYIDFYLPELNIFIEYNGELHYKAITYFEQNRSLERLTKRDNFIRNYCKDNNIQLIEIPYNEDINKYLENICILKN